MRQLLQWLVSIKKPLTCFANNLVHFVESDNKSVYDVTISIYKSYQNF